MKSTLLALVLALAATSTTRAAVDWFDPAYLEANTMDYGTGFITVPSASVVPHGWLSAGLHGYSVKVNYGLWNALEFGLSGDLEGYTDHQNITQKMLVYGRLRLLSQKRHGLNVSAGAVGIGWEDLGLGLAGFLPIPAFQHREVYYAVAGRTVPYIPSIVVTAGIGVAPPHTEDLGGGVKESREMETWFVGNISHVVFDGFMVMGEMDRKGFNVGVRMLLSAEIKLDLNLYQVQDAIDAGVKQLPFSTVLENNIRFGISYTEQWPRG